MPRGPLFLPYDVGAFVYPLRELLDDPEMRALLAASPQAGRLLRPLWRKLTTDPLPEMLRPPPRPRRRAPKRPAVARAEGGTRRARSHRARRMALSRVAVGVGRLPERALSVADLLPFVFDRDLVLPDHGLPFHGLPTRAAKPGASAASWPPPFRRSDAAPFVMYVGWRSALRVGRAIPPRCGYPTRRARRPSRRARGV